MIVAVVGSRSIQVTEKQIVAVLPPETTEILSGGAIGTDQCARQFAKIHGLVYRAFLPEYAQYGKAAPLVRNRKMIAQADKVIAFWDGSSKGTSFVISFCEKNKIPIQVVRSEE